MLNDKKPILYFLLLIAVIIIYLSVYYGKIIANPNSYLFSNQGDGIKNYYTYAYFIKNNISNTNFEGMNYPYGENFLYTDCHPALASILKFFNQYFPWLSNYSIAILNLMLLLSSGVTVMIIYLILRELKINYILAVLSALGITLLSPQILRISGHLALSYSLFIPLTIYLLLLYEKGVKRMILLFLLTIVILLFFFTHAYLGMIASTLVFTYVFIGAINQYIADKSINISKYLLLLLATVFPVVFFYTFVKITDIHTGRTTNPWGIFESYADPSTVFLPVFTPLNKIKVFFFPGIKQTFEGWSYIGFSTILGLIFYLLVSVKSSIKTRRIGLDKTWLDNAPLRNLLVTSLLILAFSMLLPFRMNLEEWLNNFNIIKQFRGIGRFAWVFYYVSTISVIYILNQAFQKLIEKRNIWLGYSLIVLIPLFLIFEGQHYQVLMSEKISQSPNLFDIKQTKNTFREDIETIDPNKYQAILPFPFFYIGSDNFGKAANDSIYQLSFLFSYHLRLPSFSSFLSRTSIDESKKIMQLLAKNFYYKRIQDDLPSGKPFLLICQTGNLNTTEINYVEKAKILIKRDEYSIYELPVAALFENNAAKEFEQYNELTDHLFEKNGFLVSDTTLYFSFIDFAQPGLDISFSDKNGCYSCLQRNYNTFFSIDGSKLALNKKYTARFWMYCEGENFGQDCLAGTIWFQKKIGDKLEWITPFTNAGNSHEIKDKWTLVELSFDCSNNEAVYDLVIKGEDISPKEFYIDDLLFYDNDLTIYKLYQSGKRITLFHHNHRIEIPADSIQAFHVIP